MKPSLILLAALAGGLALSACDDPEPNEPMAETPMEAPVAEDAAPLPETPETAPAPTDGQPDPSTLPADKRSSEESVQPESETLFY